MFRQSIVAVILSSFWVTPSLAVSAPSTTNVRAIVSQRAPTCAAMRDLSPRMEILKGGEQGRVWVNGKAYVVPLKVGTHKWLKNSLLALAAEFRVEGETIKVVHWTKMRRGGNDRQSADNPANHDQVGYYWQLGSKKGHGERCG